jgi:AcrR family transcriptional regulator
MPTTRRYDSSRRRARAQQSRDAVVAAARELFLGQGYAATTIVEIGRAAGVSPETIYKSFGNKPAIVWAIRERALAGEGPVPAEARSDAVQAEETDPHRIVAAWGRLVSEVAPLVAPVLLMMKGAATADPELAPLHAEMEADRLRRMTANARTLHDGGHLRPGVSLERARDVLFACSSPELYEVLVVGRGWTADDYGAFVAGTMAAALLPPRRGRRRG